MLFLLLGPSGVGKGTQITLLHERHQEFVFPKSVSTRKMRPGESQGNPYFFITDEEFDEHISQHDFLEYAVVHRAARYGTLKAPIKASLEQGKTVLKELDIQGLIEIQKTMSAGEADFLKGKLKSVFIMPPDEETLVERITGRSDIKEAELNTRLESARQEMAQADKCDFVIETSREDDVEAVYRQLGHTLRKARQEAEPA